MKFQILSALVFVVFNVIFAYIIYFRQKQLEKRLAGFEDSICSKLDSTYMKAKAITKNRNLDIENLIKEIRKMYAEYERIYTDTRMIDEKIEKLKQQPQPRPKFSLRQLQDFLNP